MSLDALCDEHPLSLELSSLRNAIAHYQKEAYNGSLNLQRHALDSANALQQVQALQYENAYLRKELEVHRTHQFGEDFNGDVREPLQVQELTLALRRLSDKLDIAEQAILRRSEELASVCRDRDIARHSQEVAYEIAVRLRGQLETYRAGERDLLNRVRTAEEERRMSDLVVEEYAHLVRSLEGRTPQHVSADVKENGHASRDSLDGLSVARAGLQKLLFDSNSDSEKLHAKIAGLHVALESTQATLEAERKAAADERRKLALIELELHRLRADDEAAAKMVSRYMKFSQSSTDVLHKAIENMRIRHGATLSSYDSRIRQAEDTITVERRQCERLRQALDELTEDISRESYGRRREIALRVALVGREEALSEMLKIWLLRAQEDLHRCTPSDPPDVLHARFLSILRAADSLVQAVAGISNSNALPMDDRDNQNVSPSSLARILSAQSAVAALNSELQKETDKRLFLERQVVCLHPDILQPRELVDESVSAHLSDDGNVHGHQHAVRRHQHAEKTPPISLGSPIRLVDSGSVSADGRSPEESPKQAELVGLPREGAYHSHEDLFAKTSVTSLEVLDAEETSAAPCGVPLIKSDASTSSVDFPGVSPINDNTLAEPSAPKRKAVSPEQDSTKSTHDPSLMEERDASKASSATLNAETAAAQIIRESTPQASSPDARNEANARGHGINTMEAMNDQSLLPPSDVNVPKPTSSVSITTRPIPRPELREVEEYTHDVVVLESDADAAELLLTDELVQETSAATGPHGNPSEQVSNLNLPGHSDSGVSVPVDASKNESESGENVSIENKYQSSDNSNLGNGSSVISEEDCASPSPQNDHDKDQVLFPRLFPLDKSVDEIGSDYEDCHKEDEVNSTDSTDTRLLSRLDEVVYRYDELQRSFRDCHLSLQQLKQASKNLPQSSNSYQIATERLDDYCEDARVEVEIRIADEERIKRGYQTILSVKGALSAEVDESDMRSKIEAFVEGTDPAVCRALDLLKHKLDDLQHDIACVKQAMHDPSSVDAPSEATVMQTPRRPSSNWAAWTGSILSSSRSPSPVPPTTFGAVMTSPRLRHSSSFIRSRVDSNASQNPLANLGLRIAMPVQIQPALPPASPLNRGSARLRVASNMFGLGLGASTLPGSRRTSMVNVTANVSKPPSNELADFDDDLD